MQILFQIMKAGRITDQGWHCGCVQFRIELQCFLDVNIISEFNLKEDTKQEDAELDCEQKNLKSSY